MLIDINIQYGVKPGEDITLAFTEALAELVASGVGGGTIYFSETGHYKVEGPQQTGEAFGYKYSGQILLPARTVTAGAFTVHIKGCVPPPKMLLGTPPGEYVSTVAGVVLISNAATGSMVDVVPGFEASGVPWSNISVIQEDIVTQMPPNPQATGWQLQCAKAAEGRGTVRIEAPGSVEHLNNNEALTGSGWGINLPAIGNAGDITFDTLLLHGFPVGVGLTEHVKVDYLFAGTCNWMIEGRGSGHMNEIFASCEENVGMIRSNGLGKRGTLLNMTVSMENVNTSGAFAPGVFIEDTQSELHGEIVLKPTAVTYGSFPVIGANNLNVRMLTASTPENYQGRAGWHRAYLEDNLKRAAPLSTALGTAYPTMHPLQIVKGAWSDSEGKLRMTASEEGKVTFRQPLVGLGSRWYRWAVTPAAGIAANFGLLLCEKSGKGILVRFRENKIQILGATGTVAAEAALTGGTATELFIVVHHGMAKAAATYNTPTEVQVFVGEEEKVKWALTKTEREELAQTVGQSYVTDAIKVNRDTTSFYSSLYSGALTAA